MIFGFKKGGKFLLNCVWDKDEVLEYILDNIKYDLVKLEFKFYIINVIKFVYEIGLG